MRTHRGHQEPELVYARSGYAWHRVAHGEPWIKRGDPGSWDWGNVQSAVVGNPIEGFELENCVPVRGDSTHHRLAWRNDPDLTQLANREIRLRVRASGATLYALLVGSESELANYWQFRIPGYTSMKWEQAQL